eukprot:scaffold46642_cov56-Cyclotella_meneghiniana.AAC.3
MGLVSIVAGLVASGCAVFSAIGFTVGGIAAGSIAASIQSGIGNVVAGSSFAALQSAGMSGALNAIGAAAVYELNYCPTQSAGDDPKMSTRSIVKIISESSIVHFVEKLFTEYDLR